MNVLLGLVFLVLYGQCSSYVLNGIDSFTGKNIRVKFLPNEKDEDDDLFIIKKSLLSGKDWFGRPTKPTITFSWHKYNKLGRFDRWLYSLESRYVKVRPMPTKTDEGRNILLVKVDFPNPKIHGFKKIVFIESNMHGSDWITSAVTTYFLKQLIDSKEGTDLYDLARRYTWYFVPIANPDGFAYTHTRPFDKEVRHWRKTRSQIKGKHCIGVDPALNFDFNWRPTRESKGEAKECSAHYSGPHAFSETCVQVLANKLDQIAGGGRLHAYFSFHAEKNALLLPYANPKDRSESYDDMMKIGEKILKRLKENSTQEYALGNEYEQFCKEHKRFTKKCQNSQEIPRIMGTSIDYVQNAYTPPIVVQINLRGSLASQTPRTEIIPAGVESTIIIKSFLDEYRKLRPEKDFVITTRRPKLDKTKHTTDALYYDTIFNEDGEEDEDDDENKTKKSITPPLERQITTQTPKISSLSTDPDRTSEKEKLTTLITKSSEEQKTRASDTTAEQDNEKSTITMTGQTPTTTKNQVETEDWTTIAPTQNLEIITVPPESISSEKQTTLTTEEPQKQITEKGKVKIPGKTENNTTRTQNTEINQEGTTREKDLGLLSTQTPDEFITEFKPSIEDINVTTLKTETPEYISTENYKNKTADKEIESTTTTKPEIQAKITTQVPELKTTDFDNVIEKDVLTILTTENSYISTLEFGLASNKSTKHDAESTTNKLTTKELETDKSTNLDKVSTNSPKKPSAEKVVEATTLVNNPNTATTDSKYITESSTTLTTENLNNLGTEVNLTPTSPKIDKAVTTILTVPPSKSQTENLGRLTTEEPDKYLSTNGAKKPSKSEKITTKNSKKTTTGKVSGSTIQMTTNDMTNEKGLSIITTPNPKEITTEFENSSLYNEFTLLTTKAVEKLSTENLEETTTKNASEASIELTTPKRSKENFIETVTTQNPTKETTEHDYFTEAYDITTFTINTPEILTKEAENGLPEETTNENVSEASIELTTSRTSKGKNVEAITTQNPTRETKEPDYLTEEYDIPTFTTDTPEILTTETEEVLSTIKEEKQTIPGSLSTKKSEETEKLSTENSKEMTTEEIRETSTKLTTSNTFNGQGKVTTENPEKQTSEFDTLDEENDQNRIKTEPPEDLAKEKEKVLSTPNQENTELVTRNPDEMITEEVSKSSIKLPTSSMTNKKPTEVPEKQTLEFDHSTEENYLTQFTTEIPEKLTKESEKYLSTKNQESTEKFSTKSTEDVVTEGINESSIKLPTSSAFKDVELIVTQIPEKDNSKPNHSTEENKVTDITTEILEILTKEPEKGLSTINKENKMSTENLEQIRTDEVSELFTKSTTNSETKGTDIETVTTQKGSLESDQTEAPENLTQEPKKNENTATSSVSQATIRLTTYDLEKETVTTQPEQKEKLGNSTSLEKPEKNTVTPKKDKCKFLIKLFVKKLRAANNLLKLILQNMITISHESKMKEHLINWMRNLLDQVSKSDHKIKNNIDFSLKQLKESSFDSDLHDLENVLIRYLSDDFDEKIK